MNARVQRRVQSLEERRCSALRGLDEARGCAFALKLRPVAQPDGRVGFHFKAVAQLHLRAPRGDGRVLRSGLQREMAEEIQEEACGHREGLKRPAVARSGL